MSILNYCLTLASKKKVKCNIDFSCKNKATKKCLNCFGNMSLSKHDTTLSNRKGNYETKKKCWCCNNENVVVGSKCRNCGEVV